MYTVTLIDDSSFSYNTPFQVIPSSGYQEYTFSLSIINTTLLDYEDANWRDFSFTMFVQETANSSHTDELTISIQLTNWNDESPIFDQDEYAVQIKENITINEFVAKVLADDRDVNDTVE